MLKPFATRTHEDMKDVLLDPEAEGPEIFYYMIRGGSDKKKRDSLGNRFGRQRIYQDIWALSYRSN